MGINPKHFITIKYCKTKTKPILGAGYQDQFKEINALANIVTV